MKEEDKIKEAKEAKEAKGLHKVTYLKNHGTRKKDEVVEMHLSTGKALEAHEIAKVGKKVELKEAVRGK